MPKVEDFIKHMRRLRIRRNDHIICYKSLGVDNCARAAWMLRFFGAENVQIMDGGLQKWVKEERPTFKGDYQDGAGLPVGEVGDYDYTIVDEQRIIREGDINMMHKVGYYLYNKASDWSVVDTRPGDLFHGIGPAEGFTTQEGARKGHIEGSINLPYT